MNHSEARPLAGSRYASRLLSTRSNGACWDRLDCLAPPGHPHGNICFASRAFGYQETFGIIEVHGYLDRVSGGKRYKQLSTLSSARVTEGGRCAMKVHDCAELPLALAALISLLVL